jgi:hypothetical protein
VEGASGIEDSDLSLNVIGSVSKQLNLLCVLFPRYTRIRPYTDLRVVLRFVGTVVR